MAIFVLHPSEHLLGPLLNRLTVPHGTVLPADRKEDIVIVWDDSIKPGIHEALLEAAMLRRGRIVGLHQSLRKRADRNERAKILIMNGIEVFRRKTEKKRPLSIPREMDTHTGDILHAEALGGSGNSGCHRAKGGISVTRRYDVAVFDLQAIAVYERTDGDGVMHGEGGFVLRNNGASLSGAIGGGRRELAADAGTLVRRAVRTAVRAVYALGCDYGMAHIVIGPGGQPAVDDVDPLPPLGEELGARFAAAIERLAAGHAAAAAPVGAGARSSAAAAVVPGGGTGGTTHAHRARGGTILLGADPEFVLRRPDGAVVPASRYLPRQGIAGSDAAPITAGTGVYPLAELRPEPDGEPRRLLQNLLRAMHSAARQIGDPELAWIAGGMPCEGYPLGGHVHLSGVELTGELLRTLDNYAALPLVLLEAASTKRRRPRYGFLGDFRRQPHGGFEYRTLPSWIVSPRIAKGVLALFRVIAEHHAELRQRPLLQTTVQRRYYDGDKEGVRPIVLWLWRDLQNTSSYDNYRKYLEPFHDLLRNGYDWDEQQDIRKAWKIEPISSVVKEHSRHS